MEQTPVPHGKDSWNQQETNINFSRGLQIPAIVVASYNALTFPSAGWSSSSFLSLLYITHGKPRRYEIGQAMATSDCFPVACFFNDNN